MSIKYTVEECYNGKFRVIEPAKVPAVIEKTVKGWHGLMKPGSVVVVRWMVGAEGQPLGQPYMGPARSNPEYVVTMEGSGERL